MANTLLDFVMSLVKDPDVAAQYAANPAQAIADANLAGVTSADVNQLIPMVADSMSPIVPTAGHDVLGALPVDNVWASGAATEAFDAFGDHLPQQVIDDPFGTLNQVVTSGDPSSAIDASGLDAIDVPSIAGVDDLPHVASVDPTLDDVPFADVVADHDLTQHVADQLDAHDVPMDYGLDDLI